MNELEIKVLNEIIDNMDKILKEKQYKHKDTWKSCELTYLRHEISRRVSRVFWRKDNLTPDERLRQLIHIFNYIFFLYYRLKELVDFKPLKLEVKNLMEFTILCHRCYNIKRVSTIHIAHPVVLILECGHKVDITDLKFGISQPI